MSIDLNALARAHPPEVMRLDIADAVEVLTLGEVIDAAEVAGLSLDTIRAAQLPDDPAEGYRFLRAIAWVMRRRADPSVTWAQAQTWNIEAARGPGPKADGPLTSSS